jgi:hypothetical protein
MSTLRPCSPLFAVLKKIKNLLDAVSDILTQPGRLGQVGPVFELRPTPPSVHVFKIGR